MSVRAHLTAAGVLIVGALLFVLGTPMCDNTDGDHFATAEQRRVYVAEVGPIVAAPVLAAAFVNRAGRDAVVERLALLDAPFANRQHWKLYPIWGDRYRFAEIAVDGVLVHRTNDPEHGWRAGQLQERRLGYALDAGLKGNDALFTAVFRWIVREARADFPAARAVVLTGMEGPFPGTSTEPARVVRARAPRWAAKVER